MTISNANEIKLYFHCGKCMPDLPEGESPQTWSRIECGWTPQGFQVWCKRCEANIIHLDFEGAKHPANTTRPKDSHEQA